MHKPNFVRIGDSGGSLALWHVPSKSDLEFFCSLQSTGNAKLNRVTVVCLQGTSEFSNTTISDFYSKNNINFIQFDFWKAYYNHPGSPGPVGIVTIVL